MNALSISKQVRRGWDIFKISAPRLGYFQNKCVEAGIFINIKLHEQQLKSENKRSLDAARFGERALKAAKKAIIGQFSGCKTCSYVSGTAKNRKKEELDADKAGKYV